VPALALNALDDPFIDPHTLPDPVKFRDSPVRLVYTRHGGHCGFLARNRPSRGTRKNDWMPEQLARFIDLVESEIATTTPRARL
jgi:predicted alpha/beta-fold hydrolase